MCEVLCEAQKQSKSHSNIGCFSITSDGGAPCTHCSPRRCALNSSEVHSVCWTDFPHDVINMNVFVENSCIKTAQEANMKFSDKSRFL